MGTIKVIDAMMGRGKSSAAIQYMNDNKEQKRFLYITPYLSEVDRVCDCCDFDQPDGEVMSKRNELKLKMRYGNNIASTHSLFHLLDSECMELAREHHYSLIIDEGIEIASKVKVTASDFRRIIELETEENDDGSLRWLEESYDGKFNAYKELAASGSLFHLDSSLLNVMSPDTLRSFDEVYMLTYLFKGSLQHAYLDYFGFDYTIGGIRKIGDKYEFTDRPDEPEHIDYRSLIRLVDNKAMNSVGDRKTALSKTWYSKHPKNNEQIQKLRRSMHNFFHNMTDNNSNTRMWTCFKDDKDKLVQSDGRYRSNFVQMGAKATNAYRQCTEVAYMINRFVDPNITKFFCTKGITVDQDAYALSEMLQWIWRSGIRDGKPINLYVPSKRMRTLLTDWMDDVSGGDAIA